MVQRVGLCGIKSSGVVTCHCVEGSYLWPQVVISPSCWWLLCCSPSHLSSATKFGQVTDVLSCVPNQVLSASHTSLQGHPWGFGTEKFYASGPCSLYLDTLWFPSFITRAITGLGLLWLLGHLFLRSSQKDGLWLLHFFDLQPWLEVLWFRQPPYFTRGQVTGLLSLAADLLASPLALCFPMGTERVWKVFFPDSSPSKSFLSRVWILFFSPTFYDEIFNKKKIWKNITVNICTLNTKIHPLFNILLFENKLPISCHFTPKCPSMFLLQLRTRYLLKAQPDTNIIAPKKVKTAL